MNMTLNSLAPTPAPTAPDAAAVTAAVPAFDAAAAAPAAFAQWLGLGRQADTAFLLAAAPLPTDEGAEAPEAAAPETTEQPAPADQQQVIVLAAMSMPLMAPPQAPAALRPAGAVAADEQAGEGAPALPLTAAELRTGLATAALPAAAPVAPAAAADSGAAAQPAAGRVGTRAHAAQPPAPEAPADKPLQAAAPAAAAKATVDTAPAADASAANVSDRPAGGWGVGSAAPATARAAADSTVALAGPPTAWRQTLHEALGERLNLQLTNRAEQAVIRLEPPMLGRVDIAIRHSAGTLEVTISATHGEVLRQLNAVSENLRSDLAARQFTDVAVTVAQAPRGAQAAQAGQHGDAQGRGRQPGREDQPKDPGRALADAGDSTSTFSLNGRV